MASRDAARPNVVFILSDDQGPWALGCAGNSEIRTPHLDSLAGSGTRMESFFCTSPVCSPARASLLTGRIPSQHGVHDWIRDGNDGPDSIPYLSGQIGYTEVLAAQGYRCGLSGKWHLGDSARSQKGFSHWYAHQKGSGHYYDAPMYREGRLVHEPGYVTDLITDDALAFMKECSEGDQPFYVSVHYTAPHSPWLDGEHPPEITSLYADCPFTSCPQEPHHPQAVLRMNAADARDCLIGYFAAVTAMDRNIGRLLRSLEELGLRESTLVCFVSDNGFNCGHHGIWGKGNGTLDLNMYDTSVKVPAIFSQPGRIEEGIVCEELVSGYDFAPTLLDYLGFEMPELTSGERVLLRPGRSFACLLEGAAQEAEGDERVVVFDEYGRTRMVRTREWKYVHRHAGSDELYDLHDDPEERENLVDNVARRSLVAELKATLEDWFARHADPGRDGAEEPVSGNGQTGLVGQGKLVFDQGRRPTNNPRHDPGMKKGE
jgi:arylsulfatase A-like enzyme